MSRNRRFHSAFVCFFLLISCALAMAQLKLEKIPRLSTARHRRHFEIDRADRLRKELKESQDKRFKEMTATQSLKYNEMRIKVSGLENKIKRLESNLESLLQNGIQFRTCAEMRKANPYLQSGYFWIDPDGHGIGDGPIRVYCDMTKGATSIFHEIEEPTDVKDCAATGCYSTPVNYDATYEQMKALADASAECHQFIRYDCHRSPFVKNQVTSNWWNDRYGRPQSFWSDTRFTSLTCPYGRIGFVNDKEKLPITRLNYQGIRQSNPSANFTLGRFTCKGEEKFDQKPSSCKDLRSIGHTLNGFYSVKGEKSVDMVFCNFTKDIAQKDFQKRIGQVDVKTPVYFYVQRNLPINQEARLTFKNEIVNIGGAMNLKTGVFTAPKDGIYFFIFSGLIKFTTDVKTSCIIFLEGVESNVNALFSGDNSSPSSASLHATSFLKSGSRVHLYKTGYIENQNVSQLYDSSSLHFTHFSGGLLQEELSP